ncbi:oxygen-binding di-iron domain-containing protein [Caminibacter pacificus]
MGFSLPVKLKDGIYWVGCDSARLLNSNMYLIKDEDVGVLVDPAWSQSGCFYDKLSTLMDLDKIKYVIVQNYEPDTVKALELLKKTLKDFQIVTHWKISMFLNKFDLNVPMYIIDENDWKLKLPTKELEFIFTPFNYFAGSFCTYDKTSKTVFSGELFSVVKNKFGLYVDKEPLYLYSLKTFHKLYLPLEYAKKAVKNIPEEVELIAPKYGSVLEDEFIPKAKKEILSIEKEFDFDSVREDIMSNLYKDLVYLDFKDAFKNLFKNLQKAIESIIMLELKVENETLHQGLNKSKSIIKKDGEIEGINAELSVGLSNSGLNEELTQFLESLLDRLLYPLVNSYKREQILNKNKYERNPILDPLTGLFSVEYLEFLKPKLKQSVRYKFPITMGVVNIDFDEQTGKLYKECIIREAAKYLQNHFRSSDVLLRIDEGKFLIVMPFTFEKDAKKKMMLVIDGLNQKAFCGTKNMHVKAKTSVLEYDKESTLEDFLKKLDKSTFEPIFITYLS